MIEIRLMHNSDIESVRELIFRAFAKKSQKNYKNTKSTFNVIACLDHKICGVATVYVHTDDLIDEKDYFISNLCVDPEYKRRGVATKLIEFIENKGKEDDIKYIYTLVPSKYEETNRLYTKLNYDLKNINCFRKEL